MRLILWREALLSLLAVLALARPAIADTYPSNTVRIVVPNTAGSAADVVARQLGQRLTQAWHQPVLVDNRAGAGGVVAADAVAKSAADGYTLLLGADGPITILPHMSTPLPYVPARDLVPVVSLAETDFVLVANPKSGWKTLQDLVRAAKAQPGRFNYASAGNGSPQQLGAELLKQAAGIHLTHIPYRGGPQGLSDVLSGQVDAMFIAIAPALAHIQSGRLVALASGGEQRTPLLPQVPTVAESYPGFRAGTWFGLFVPVGTPKHIVESLGADVTRVLANPALRSELAAQGIRTTGYPQNDFQQRVNDESRKYAALVKTAGIHAD